MAVVAVVGSVLSLVFLAVHSGSIGATSLGLAMLAFLGVYILGMPLLVLQRAMEGADKTHEVTLASLVPSLWVLLFSFALSRQEAPLLAYCLAAGAGDLRARPLRNG